MDVVALRILSEPVDADDLNAAVERTHGRIALAAGPEELLALYHFERPCRLRCSCQNETCG